ncbi:hypothetical protein [Moraxella caprae]|nr:hypothetical protein [Moraxella caprae]
MFHAPSRIKHPVDKCEFLAFTKDLTKKNPAITTGFFWIASN